MTDDKIISQRYKNRNYPRVTYHPLTGRRVNPQYMRFLADEEQPALQNLKTGIRDLTETVTIEFQGEVIKARCYNVPDRKQMGEGRSAIKEFSAKSRKNMLDTVSRLDWTIPAQFITLTYHENLRNAKKAKRDLRAFLKRIYRRYGNVASIWKMEPQSRGAWHFHLIVFQLPYISKNEVLEHWREVAGDISITQVKIEPIKSAKKARSYTAKYCAKPIKRDRVTSLLMLLWGFPAWAVVAVYLDHAPNLAGLHLPGRFWGIENRKNLIWAVLKTVSIILDGAYHNFKRAARRKWSGINTTERAGFTLYAENLDKWIDYLFYLAGKNYQPI